MSDVGAPFSVAAGTTHILWPCFATSSCNLVEDIIVVITYGFPAAIVIHGVVGLRGAVFQCDGLLWKIAHARKQAVW